MKNLVDRFIKYIKIDSQSNPESETTPSTEKQWNMANLLVEELKAIGLQDVTVDKNAYVMATLPSNVDYPVPTIGFISHFDTSPDFSGENVNPQFVENYDGGDIVLNKEQNIVLSPSYFEDLLLYKGNTIITTDGTTLLGADDKAGIAEIVTAMEYLVQHPEIKHGKIRVGFTPDEEIGRGAHKFDVKKFAADWAYTMDGGQIGELEYESFNAAGAKIHFKGKNVHPGTAKNKMINSMLVATQFINALPADEIPARTEGREGFYHITDISGDVENTVVQLIIRDHDRDLFNKRKAVVQQIVDDLNKQIPNVAVAEIKDQYYNMGEKIKPVMHIVEVAERAMKELGITPITKPIRGGTDGSQLSFMGLPCPNIFAGGHNFHGKYEFVPVENLEKATEVIIRIAELVAKK